jgi:FtsH-binding integral membrane protein
MMVVSSVFPNVFLSIGRALGITLLITVLVELVMMLFGASLAITDYVVVLIFCGYVGYDWARANACAKTVDNAVDSAAELYVDIVNLFVRILRILARNNRN